jgi:hypothetical protein
VSLESSFDGLSNNEGNLRNLAQLRRKLWVVEFFPKWEGIGQTEQNVTTDTFLGGNCQKKVLCPLELFPHFEHPGN